MFPSIVMYHYQFNLTSVTCLLTVKWSNSSFSSNSIYHESFVCTHFKCEADIFYQFIGPYQVLPLRARVDPRVMTMRVYSTFPKGPELLEPHYQNIQCHKTTLVGWGLLLCRDIVVVFYTSDVWAYMCVNYWRVLKACERLSAFKDCFSLICV